MLVVSYMYYVDRDIEWDGMNDDRVQQREHYHISLISIA